MIKKKIILIADNNLSHIEAMKESLSELNNDYTILIAASHSEYKVLTSRIVPDLVLAEVNLPDGGIFDILNGRLDGRLRWPVIVITSHSDGETAVKAIKSGAMDYIVKSPGSYKTLARRIKQNISEWENIQRKNENEKEFHILFDTMVQGAVYQDGEGCIIDANPAAERVLGVSFEQMNCASPLNPPWIMFHEDGRPLLPLESPPMVALKTGIPVRDVVMRVSDCSGKGNRWLLVNSIPQFRGSENKPYRVFTTYVDITELTLAKEKAEESDRFKTSFIANISHEIRTPMSGIKGFADLLKNPSLSGEKQAIYIKEILESSKRMLNILNDLINISEIESGYVDVKLSSTNISGLLNEQYEMFLTEARQRSIELKLINKLPADKTFLNTDGKKVRQILTNLLSNALKFTREGSVEFGCYLDNKDYMFWVKDTGSGIEKQNQEKIFERFRPGRNTRSGLQEGVGVGLAICRAYAGMLGGSVTVDSEIGKGSIFHVIIPDKGPGKSLLTNHKAESKRADETSEILIAEDEYFIYAYLSELFRLHNITTSHASNGQEAVNAVKARPNIQLVLMDGRMPVMNGLEATRQIKRLRPEIPIIALSALANDMDIQEALNAGCVAYVTKPVDIRDLFEKISSYSNYKIAQ
jgi:signal transduction histidine kinase/DNA-binding response OmpR family regulator